MALPLDASLRDRLHAALVAADLDEICENWGLPTKSAGTGVGFKNLQDVLLAMLDPSGELDRFCQRPICSVCKGEGGVEAHEKLYCCTQCKGVGRIVVPRVHPGEQAVRDLLARKSTPPR